MTVALIVLAVWLAGVVAVLVLCKAAAAGDTPDDVPTEALEPVEPLRAGTELDEGTPCYLGRDGLVWPYPRGW